MTRVLPNLRHLLAKLFSRHGRIPLQYFKKIYLGCIATSVLISLIPLVEPRNFLALVAMVLVLVVFLAVARAATKRHRDTLPFRLGRKVETATELTDQGFYCGFAFLLVPFSLIVLQTTGSAIGMLFLLSASAALHYLLRFLWIAPSYPGHNNFGPNPLEATA